MSEIKRIVDTCTIKVSDKWSWRGLVGKEIRLIAVMPPEKKDQFKAAVREMEALVGREIRLVAPFYVETGLVLVAEVEIEGIDIKKFFGERYHRHPPRERVMEPGDIRTIRRVQGRKRTSWRNPISRLEASEKPVLGNIEFPTDPWIPGYKIDLARAKRVFSDDRLHPRNDNNALRAFLSNRNQRMLILFGNCGCGKSWFVRNYLVNNPPKDMDIGFIDAAGFPRGEGFGKAFYDRIHLRLSEILGEHVNKRPGGLLEALRPILETEIKGIFPGDDALIKEYQAFSRRYLSDLMRHDNLAEYNWIRLRSYAYSKRKLLLVIDNIDQICHHKDQGEVLERVIQAVTRSRGVFMIVPLRHSSALISARLNFLMQNLLLGHHLSHLDMTSMIKTRLTTSLRGRDIIAITVEDKVNKRNYRLLEILNLYLNSESELIIENLAAGDARHYIRLFRRLLFSDELCGFENIGKDYFCIGSLMLKPDEGFKEDTSFILNVFDNEHPNEIGNALVRWRVLEYFLNGHDRCEGEFFRYYFQRLGYDLERVEEAIRTWNEAGALELYERKEGVQAKLTACARRYDQLINNLWYCISIKTGMHMDQRYILTGKEAREEAHKYRVTLPRSCEWVSDAGFLDFAAEEEALEEDRLSQYPGKVPNFEEQCRSRGPRSIHYRLEVEYAYQQRRWNLARDKYWRRR